MNPAGYKRVQEIEDAITAAAAPAGHENLAPPSLLFGFAFAYSNLRARGVPAWLFVELMGALDLMNGQMPTEAAKKEAERVREQITEMEKSQARWPHPNLHPDECECDRCEIDLDLLAKLARGEGGRRTGALLRAGLLEWKVTPEGLAALEKARLDGGHQGT